MSSVTPEGPESNEENPKKRDESPEPEVPEGKPLTPKAPSNSELYQYLFQMEEMTHDPRYEFTERLTEAHIDKLLDIERDGEQLEYKDRNWQRGFFMISFLILVGFLITVLVLFRDKPNVLAPIISGVGGLISGFIGGIGYGKLGNK